MNREKIFTALLMLYTLLLSTTFLAGGAILLMLIFFLIDRKENLRKKCKIACNHPLTILFIIYFLFHIVGYFMSKDKSMALTDIEHKLSFLILPPIILGEYISKNNIKKVFLFFKNVIIITLSVLLMYHFIRYNKGLGEFTHFGFRDLSISYFYFSVFIIFSILIIDYFKPKYYKFQILILLFFLLLISNRAAILFILFYYIFWKKGYKFLLNIRVVFILVLLGLFLFSTDNLLIRKMKVFYRTTDLNMETIRTKNSISITHNTLEHRIYIWKLASSLIKENFLFGIGTGDFQKELNKLYHQYNFKAAKLKNYNTHNQYLEEFLKFGLIGGLFFIGMIWYLLKISRRKPLFFLTVLLIAWGSIFESYWFRHHGILFISFFIPLLYKYYLPNNVLDEK